MPAVATDDITINGRKLFRHFDKRIALFRTERAIYAVDNRCPHQGYALLQGDVKDEQLTCAWHNWKFELDEDGLCSFGGEAVRSYPVDVRVSLARVVDAWAVVGAGASARAAGRRDGVTETISVWVDLVVGTAVGVDDLRGGRAGTEVRSVHDAVAVGVGA